MRAQADATYDIALRIAPGKAGGPFCGSAGFIGPALLRWTFVGCRPTRRLCTLKRSGLGFLKSLSSTSYFAGRKSACLPNSPSHPTSAPGPP